MSGVSDQQTGLASGLVNTAQQIGAALGLAILSTIATSATSSALKAGAHDPHVLPDALTHGFRAAFLGGAAFAALAAGLAPVLFTGTTRHQGQALPQPVE